MGKKYPPVYVGFKVLRIEYMKNGVYINDFCLCHIYNLFTCY